MEPTEFNKKRWADELGLSLEDFDSRFATLCTNLGVHPLLPDTVRWSEVAFRLLQTRPEFTEAKRGRPPLGRHGLSKDYQRALAVSLLRRKREASNPRHRVTDKMLIKELYDSGHELFRNITNAAQSVSNGNKLLKREQAERERSRRELNKLAAKIIKLDAEVRRLEKMALPHLNLAVMGPPDTKVENSD